MDVITEKQCQKCGTTKATSDFFPSGRTRDGYNKKCLACIAEERGMTEDEYLWYYLTHHASKRGYAAAHSEKNVQASKKWQKENPDEFKAIQKAYRNRNPVIIRENAARRKGRMKAVEIFDFTDAQWAEVKEQFNYSCAYCGCGDCNLAMDHIIPVSRGGNHTKNNIVPACKSCNSKKGTKTLEEAGMRISNSI